MDDVCFIKDKIDLSRKQSKGSTVAWLMSSHISEHWNLLELHCIEIFEIPDGVELHIPEFIHDWYLRFTVDVTQSSTPRGIEKN